MASVVGQSLNDVEVLTWKILMNEQDAHGVSEPLQRLGFVLEFTKQQLQI